MSGPTFVVSIPTLRSVATLEAAIRSVQVQQTDDVELNVVDSLSTDGTPELARSLGVEVIDYPGKLLGARFEGFAHSTADFVVFLDSDQVLGPTTLQRLSAVVAAGDVDMVILEERSHRRDTVVQRMYDLDRQIVQGDFDYNVSPEHGVLLPRVFRRTLLLEAFAKIDPTLYPEVVAHDHAIIYFECWALSQRVTFLKDAVFHQELRTLRETYHHFVSYGRNTRRFEQMGLYTDLIQSKMRGRNRGFLRQLASRKLLTTPLLLAKAAGYWSGHRRG